MFLLRKLKAMCKKVHNNYQKHFRLFKNWSCNKKVITMGVFVYDFYPFIRIWYLPLVRCPQSWQISHPHSWIQIVYKTTHDITSIYIYVYYNYSKLISVKSLKSLPSGLIKLYKKYIYHPTLEIYCKCYFHEYFWVKDILKLVPKAK